MPTNNLTLYNCYIEQATKQSLCPIYATAQRSRFGNFALDHFKHIKRIKIVMWLIWMLFCFFLFLRLSFTLRFSTFSRFFFIYSDQIRVLNTLQTVLRCYRLLSFTRSFASWQYSIFWFHKNIIIIKIIYTFFSFTFHTTLHITANGLVYQPLLLLLHIIVSLFFLLQFLKKYKKKLRKIYSWIMCAQGNGNKL